MSRRHPQGDDIAVTLPITQFLDMAFQLLFFFMATFNPSPLEGEMDLALPTEKVARTPGNAPVDPRIPAPQGLEDMFFDLTVEVKSETSRYSLTLVEGAVRTPITTDDPTKSLKERLSKRWHEREDSIAEKSAAIDVKDRDEWRKKELARLGVKLIGNRELRWEHLVEVMDVVNRSGWKTVTVAAPYDYRVSAID
jgi:hypothetical protein